ncbi:dnaJ homolog subfamily C member 9-like isoform X1 [Argiope bruennichi]|uniref:dnaJ homolog subfamily C member 9-like isoform X1 n=1 Tax=Argiope bruennichi TaxID=94029 RepID=UPI002494B3D7|nr:dnaJ homolog subfamily C member 9-like isoform X1 [Argiope bruennichi]
MGLIDCCEQDFGTKSLYGVLGVEKTVTTKELQQAYRKASLFLLPAQAPAHRLAEFCRKFEILSKVHYILSDKKKRQIYDETGVVDNICANFWTRYWRKLFPHIVPEDIEDFKERYKKSIMVQDCIRRHWYIYILLSKDSEEEKEDLRIAYLRVKGNMDRFAEIYFAYTAEDEDRICHIMQKELINRKKMRAYVKFTNEKPANVEARKNKYKKPDPEDDPACVNPIVLVLRQKKLNIEERRAKENKEQRKRGEAAGNAVRRKKRRRR